MSRKFDTDLVPYIKRMEIILRNINTQFVVGIQKKMVGFIIRDMHFSNDAIHFYCLGLIPDIALNFSQKENISAVGRKS